MTQAASNSGLPIASRVLHIEESGAEAIAFDRGTQQFHLLNETAYEIYKACNGSTSVHNIALSLALKFNSTDFDGVLNDVLEALGSFREKGLIQFVIDDQFQPSQPATEAAVTDSPLFSVSVSGTSMFPILLSGDKVLVKKSLFKEWRTGDIVVWRDESDKLIAHRIRSIDASATPPSIVTQGDLCTLPDLPIQPEMVLGKVVAIQREKGIQWITEIDAAHSAEKARDLDEKQESVKLAQESKPSYKGLQVLDLREISAESICNIGSIEDASMILLSPKNADALSGVTMRDIKCVFVVPENYWVYTGQPELLPEMVEFMAAPLRLVVLGQIFLTEFEPEQILKGIGELILRGNAYVSSSEAKAALESRTKITSGDISVLPQKHVRWIGTSLAGPEYTGGASQEPLIAHGSLVISERLEDVPENVSRFNKIMRPENHAAAKQ